MKFLNDVFKIMLLAGFVFAIKACSSDPLAEVARGEVRGRINETGGAIYLAKF